MEKRHRSSLNSSSVTDLRSSSSSKSLRPVALRALISSIPVSSPLAPSLPKSLLDTISRLVHEIRDPILGPTSSVSPPAKQPRRASLLLPTDSSDGDPGKQALEKIRIFASVVSGCVRSGCGSFSTNDFLPSVKLLHDNLVNFELHGGLYSEVVKLCEVWWKEGFPQGRGDFAVSPVFAVEVVDLEEEGGCA